MQDHAHYTRFERAALPPPEEFFRGNLQGFRRFGSRARAVCPFHPRAKHQNLSLDLERGLFHCFVCNASGDLVDFVRLRDGVNFREAARRLSALVPMTGIEARRFQREREFHVQRKQAQAAAWAHQLQGLLHDMQLYERLRDRGIPGAKEGVLLTGQRYLLARLEAGR